MLRKNSKYKIRSRSPFVQKMYYLENITVLVSRSWQKKGGKLYRCKNMKNLLKLFVNIHVFMIKPKRSIRAELWPTEGRKEVADQLIFIEYGKLKKLRHLSLTPIEILLSFCKISYSKMLFCFYVIASRAKPAFENLKKNYTKKRSNLRNSKKSGAF